MEESRQHSHRQQHVEIFSKNRYHIAQSKQAQDKDHHMLAVEPGHDKGHGGSRHRNPHGKETDKPPCLYNGNIVIFGNVGQDSNKAHLSIQDAKNTGCQDKQKYILAFQIIPPSLQKPPPQGRFIQIL